ncbi:transglutaminase-like domain-containing protein [Nevskia soli]|uniref:transglutaminase-like domain-containing protein n=1 Tax=Nevskia soli TaxID=418856 RepID=UPI00146FD650|nr:transglutaminase-like domain-containing protein [Nevskia soli]
MGAGCGNRAMRVSWVHLRLLWMVVLAHSLSACVGLPEQPAISQEDVAWVSGGGGLSRAPEDGAIEDASTLMRVTPEMRRFANEATAGEVSVQGKVVALAEALGDADKRHVRYDAEATLTAEQAFLQRRANCLSYTLLFVALAREVGIPAEFNEVDVPPIWDLGDDRTSLLYRHINARIDLFHGYRVVDVSGDEYDPAYDQRVISDTAALAQFYNNRAVELRLKQRQAEALRYALRALELSPDTAYLWTNLASLYLLDGNVRAARIAVTQSLQLDASSMMSYDTASQVYEQLGEPRLARYFHQRAQYFLEQNPYHHYQLALAALRADDKEVAYNETRRAIGMYSKDARFFFLMAVVLNQMGKEVLASQSMQVAIDLTSDPAQQERYRSKFARLTKQG